MVECPVGVTNFFMIDRFNNRWKRNDEPAPEYFDVPDNFIKSETYQYYARIELMSLRPIHFSHWQFNFS